MRQTTQGQQSVFRTFPRLANFCTYLEYRLGLLAGVITRTVYFTATHYTRSEMKALHPMVALVVQSREEIEGPWNLMQ